MSELDSNVEYRDVQGFLGYKVGSDGSVWSCRTTAPMGLPKGTKGIGVVGMKWRRLTPDTTMKRGCHRVSLCRNGIICRRLVSHLVLEAFVGPRPKGMEACHFPDLDTANNALSNLRWGTHLDNLADMEVHGTRLRGTHHPNSVLSRDDVIELRRRYAANEATKLLMQDFGLSANTVVRVATGRGYPDIPGAVPANRTGPRYLLSDQVIALRRRYGSGEPIKNLMRDFGLSRHTIRNIATGRTYRQIAGAMPTRTPGGRRKP